MLQRLSSLGFVCVCVIYMQEVLGKFQCVLTFKFAYASKNDNLIIVSSVQQKSSGLKFSKSRTGSHVTYSCHHNSSCFTFPIFVNLWRFSVFRSLQSITLRIY